MRPVPSGFVRALSAATTVFLLVTSASVSAITYSVVAGQARYARAIAPQQAVQAVQAATPETPSITVLPPAPQATPQLAPTPSFTPVPLGAAMSLAMMGPHTHDVDELWRRAEQLAMSGVDVTLSRIALPRGAIAWGDAGALHVVPEPHKGVDGLRVIAVGGRSAPALAGVRPGDLVVAVNGYALGEPQNGSRAFTAAREAGTLIAEVWRDGRRLVLRVGWRS